jgi:2-amino-4-hydroxy-6-hydroxymethyldihydropteridine diphosphokinase
VNAAVAVRASGSAASLLARLHEIESEFGRERAERWGMRTLDLDLLAFGDQVLPSDTSFSEWAALTPEVQRTRAPDELILPHPRMHERAFVLIPLLDIAPDWVHPVFKQSVREMAAALPDSETSGIIALKT